MRRTHSVGGSATGTYRVRGGLSGTDGICGCI